MLKLMFLLTLRSLWLVFRTWIELVRAIVNFHSKMCWGFISWTVNITTLPLRALGALRREKMLERLLQEMQSELESLSWDNTKLQARLHMAVKEYQLIESMLAEIEEEHDIAIGKIEHLEREVEHLRNENLRVREAQSKGLWDPVCKSITGDEPATGAHSGYGLSGSPWQFSKYDNSNLLADPYMRKDPWGSEKITGTEVNPTGLVDPLTPLVFSSSVDTDAALDQRREVAMFQSLFSALLSLLVGAVIWESEDPCIPLVMALFSVVGLSLRSVVQFFSTIKNRPASDAVALLSFNWFILGTLTYPTLPKVARLLSPMIVSLLE